MEAKSKKAPAKPTAPKAEVKKESSKAARAEEAKADPKTAEPEEKVDAETAKLIASDIGLISKLENYCSEAKFTQPINDFIAEHAERFQEIEEEKGYPHEYYVLYTNYIKLIDDMLESILLFQYYLSY